MNDDIEVKVKEIERLYAEDLSSPFPYRDCQKLQDSLAADEDFATQLTSYFSTVAGFCSWGKRILRWNEKKRREVVKILAKSFFEGLPQYRKLEKQINKIETPELYKEIERHETMRRTLLDIISRLEKSGNKQEIEEIAA
jgi:hypothetical protein